MKIRSTAILASILLAGTHLPVSAIYLNDQNILVALGSSMSAEPFQNQTTAVSLAKIDAPNAAASENHVSPTTHVWVSGGSLELDFDFGVDDRSN